ncbi:MAG: hypothetical protein ACK5UI_08495 [Bacteroidota bacterium]
MKNTNSIQKCEHCSIWTDGNKAYCSECGEILDLNFRKERHELQKKLENLPLFMDWVKLNNSRKNPFLFLLEKMIQGGQLIVSIIVLLVTVFLFLMPG